MKTILDINKETLANFYTMKDLVNAMTRNQKVWSWGARGWTNIENKFLKFRVSGHHHKGCVYVCVNGKDLFDIYLTNLKGKVVHEMHDVYVDEFINRIDEKVELIPAYKW